MYDGKRQTDMYCLQVFAVFLGPKRRKKQLFSFHPGHQQLSTPTDVLVY